MNLTDDDDPLEEVDANLHDVHDGLQALLVLMAGCGSATAVPVRGLRVLLLPMADQIEQAALASQLLRQAEPPPP
jgi:hypothetical protein